MPSLRAQPAFLVFILSLGLILTGCSAAVPQPAQVITVVSTVEVEITRMVPVPQTVEVTREVRVTQVVEVPVTLTPAPASLETATQASPSPTTAPTMAVTTVSLTPTVPAHKEAGFAFLKLTNDTDATLTVVLDGPSYRSIDIPARQFILIFVSQGLYTFRAIQNSQTLHVGSLKINNPDKYELKFREDKVIILPP